MDFRTIKGVDYYVFEDHDEFEKFYQDRNQDVPALVLDWREGEKGDWVLADDGGIVQVLASGNLRHKGDRPNYQYSKGWLRTVVGTFVRRRTVYMDTDFNQHPNRYRFGSTDDGPAAERRKRRKNLTNKERKFVALVQTGMHPNTAFMEVYDSKPHYVEKKVNQLLKTDRVMKALSQNIDEICAELGIDYKSIMQRLLELSDQDSSPNVALSALKEIAEITGLKGSGATKVVDNRSVNIMAPVSQQDIEKFEQDRLESLTEAKVG